MKITYSLIVDTTTGDVTLTKESGEAVKTTSSPKKVKDDGDPTPKITLEENKYKLNSAAVKLLQVAPNDRLDIKYEKNGNNFIPVIGHDIDFGTGSGNKVTKSYTVACRGKANDSLKAYGTIFTLEAHPEKSGLFILKGDAPVEEESDPNINFIESDNPFDLDLDELADSTTISSTDFSL